MSEGQQALGLQWTYSFSRDVPGSVVYLANGDDNRVAYASAHTLVLYNDSDHTQQLLQGHRNSITAVVASPDRRLVITADKGPDSLLVVWDPMEGEPLRTVQEPHPGGVMALDLCTGPQGELLMVTLGAADAETGEQSIALREVFGTDDEPLISCSIPVGDVQKHVTFNQSNTAEIMTNGDQRVYFWGNQLPVANTFKYYSPPLSQKDFKQAIGRFTQSTFVPGTTQAVTATDDGDVVVWEQQGISAQIGTRATDRRAIKLLRVHHSPVLILCCWGPYVVTGGGDGFVRFFDPQMRLMAWFEEMEAGGVSSISFSAVMPDYDAETIATEEGEVAQFQVPQFVIGTTEAKICLVDSRSFEDPSIQFPSIVLQEGCSGSVVAMVCHPIKPEFLLIGSSTCLTRWCMHTRRLLSSTQLPHGMANDIALSRDGSQLLVGYDNGLLQLLNSDNLSGELVLFKNTLKPITHVAMSSSGTHMACMDAAYHLALYAYGPVKGTNRWEYVGKYKAHHARVVSLIFGEAPSGQTRLFSLGQDGRAAEVDLESSTPASGVQLKQLTNVFGVEGGPAVPTSMAFAPPMAYHAAGATNTMLVVSDDSYKLTMFDADTRQCTSTYLGPTYAGPITRMAMFRSVASKDFHLAYATDNKIVGLVAMPLDGNPDKSMGLIAHPGTVAAMAVSYDGRKMLTADPDGVINMWGVTTMGLDLAATTAQASSSKWAELIASGEGSEAFQEIQDYFLYAQIRSQGEDSTAPREVLGKIPVEALPDILRALGYYPTKTEVSAMLTDINTKAEAREEPTPTHISFEEFLSLYANYRPVAGVIKDDITNAFKILSGGKGELTRDDLVRALTSEGEMMTEDELAECLYVLTGLEAQGNPKDVLSEVISAKSFAEDILGFEPEHAGLGVEGEEL